MLIYENIDPKTVSFVAKVDERGKFLAGDKQSYKEAYKGGELTSGYVLVESATEFIGKKRVLSQEDFDPKLIEDDYNKPKLRKAITVLLKRKDSNA